MLNKICLISCLLFCKLTFAQSIEANSRPYRFYIDKVLEYEAVSEKCSISIQDNKERIASRLETEIERWYEKFGKKFERDADFEDKILAELERIQPLVIQEIGIEMMSRCQPVYNFIPEEFAFEIYYSGFESIKISVPATDVESFKRNFQKLEYSGQHISYNEADQFVINKLDVSAPDLERVYSYVNPNPYNGGRSFEINYPGP